MKPGALAVNAAHTMRPSALDAATTPHHDGGTERYGNTLLEEHVRRHHRLYTASIDVL
jgi:hypothetical protein